jgi:hypothetical protein
LRGKIVSIGAYNDLTDFVLRAILARQHMDRERTSKISSLPAAARD